MESVPVLFQNFLIAAQMLVIALLALTLKMMVVVVALTHNLYILVLHVDAQQVLPKITIHVNVEIIRFTTVKLICVNVNSNLQEIVPEHAQLVRKKQKCIIKIQNNVNALLVQLKQQEFAFVLFLNFFILVVVIAQLIS